MSSAHPEFTDSTSATSSSFSLKDVSRAIYQSLGLPLTAPISLTPSKGIEILFLIDGLGEQSLMEYAQWAPNISSMVSLGNLSSEFPSTTATSLTSVGTGLTPAEHGMLG
ncbi:MAG: alkaline phosphatase family protein, partial [Candidatus Nanopelagicaceae bacterium]